MTDATEVRVTFVRPGGVATKTFADGSAAMRICLVRPDRCQSCHAVRPLDGHHADYSRPLEVQWLCRLCHRRRHYAPDVLPGQFALPLDAGGGG